LERSIAVWHDCGSDFPPLEPEYSVAQQLDCEKHLDRFFKSIEAELLRLPRTRADRDRSRERITAAFMDFGRGAAGLQNQHLKLLLEGGFSAIGTELGRQAKRFDPGVSTTDIVQACRNAWTACGLQALLAGKMRVTPSIFAYSMLYPYSDNYMDDPAIAREAKLSFSERFRDRLAGDGVAPVNDREATIWRLVGLIESQYARAAYPQVFESLRAIHKAQEESLRLLRRRGAADVIVDVLALSFAKGGSSVLADAYLAGGSVTGDQARFAFDWGVLLQLADDLQDVRADRERGLLTLFSQASERGPLDEVTNRTLQFARKVMAQLDAFQAPGTEALKDLIQSSSYSLLIRSAGEAGESYSKPYLARIESRSPFRFAFWRERRAQLARRGNVLKKLFEVFLAGDDDEPAFPWLPNTLIPAS
jgi:hypothetical protein